MEVELARVNKMKLFVLLIFTLLTLQAHAIPLKCQFRIESKTDYECFIDSLEIHSKDNRNITQVTGAHASGKTNDNVNGIRALHANIEFFPRGLEKFFKNLEYFHIWQSNLSEITGDDLRAFRRLKKFDVFDNDIEEIEDDLFDYTPNLEFISLASNEIWRVENGTFDGLKSLKKLDFDKNVCYKGDDDEEKLQELIDEIEEKCVNFVKKGSEVDESDEDSKENVDDEDNSSFRMSGSGILMIFMGIFWVL